MADESSSNPLFGGVYHLGFSYPDDVTGVVDNNLDDEEPQTIISCWDEDELTIDLNGQSVVVPASERLRFIQFLRQTIEMLSRQRESAVSS